MTSDKESPAGFSLKRWSRRKLAASREARADVPAQPLPPAPPPVAQPSEPTAAEAKPPELPSVDSLTTESDFTPFMRADVDAGLQHKALRKLFSDPRFNVMDGLDVYIDDYSKPDPIAADVVAGLAQARYIFDPPVTRIDENGVVVDVPPPCPEAGALPAPTTSGDLPDAAAEPKSEETPERTGAAANAASAPAIEPAPSVESEATGSAAEVPVNHDVPPPR